MTHVSLFAISLLFTAGLTFPQEPAPPAQGSTVAVDPLGRGLWVVDEEYEAVLLIPERGEPTRIPVGAWPEQLVVDQRGRVFVSCRQAGEVYVIDELLRTLPVPVGSEPRALALDERRGRLYVGLFTEQALAAVDLSSLQVVARRTVDGEPQALALMPDGLAVLPRRGGTVVLVDPSLHGEMDWTVQLNGSDRKAWHGHALVPAGKDLIVLHTEVDTGLGRASSRDGYGGSVEEPVNSLISVVRNGKALRGGADFEDFRLIFDVGDITGAVLRNNNLLVLASRGSQELVGIPINTAKKWIGDPVPTTVGAGLSGLALDRRGRILAVAAFDRTVVSTRFTPETKSNPGFGVHRRFSMGPGRLDPEVALGRRLFHATTDFRISANLMGCVTCHPDGREDGLVWRLKGTRRQTPMLAGRLAETAPYNWVGTGKTLEQNIHQTVRRLDGEGLSAKEARALARYLVEGLRPVSAPAPRGAQELLAEGRALFHDREVGCSSCHPSDAAFTDGEVHDVNTVSKRELAEMKAINPKAREDSLNTPDLRHLALTAPYYHDGSAPTLEELIASNQDRMGKTSHLSDSQKHALVAYLRSL